MGGNGRGVSHGLKQLVGQRKVDIMAPGGGYVGGASHDYILEENTLENVLAMFDTIMEYKTKWQA